MEEKDGGEKVRLGMVASYNCCVEERARANIALAGHSRKFCRYARGAGEDRRRKRKQRLKQYAYTSMNVCELIWVM